MADHAGSETSRSEPAAAPPRASGVSMADPYQVVFGTYNYSHLEILEDAISQAMYLLQLYKQPQLIDTAMKYRNLESLLKVVEQHPKALIGWKVEHSPRVTTLTRFQSSETEQDRIKANEKSIREEESEENNSISQTKNQPSNEQNGKKTMNGKSMYDGISYLKDNVPVKKIFRILLHNYCGKKSYLEFQRLVEQEFGPSMPIGICNVSAEQLEDLLRSNSPQIHTDEKPAPAEDQKARIDWVQNEYHPFLETYVPDVCRRHGIRFEAHSVMTNADEYSEMFKRIGHVSDFPFETKAAELALKYAQKQGSVCFTTSNFSHLQQDLKTLLVPDTEEVDETLLTAMSQFSSFKRVVWYKGAMTAVNTDWITNCDPVQIHTEILPKLKMDIAAFEAGRIPSDLCIYFPKRFGTGYKVHSLLAEMLHGENVEAQMNELRKKLEQKTMRNKTTGTMTDEELKIRLLARWNGKLHAVLRKMRFAVTKEKDSQRVILKKAPKPVQAVQQPEALQMFSYPEANQFADLIQFIKEGGSLGIQGDNKELPVNIRFQHGTVNSDGRLDLCKQGFRHAFAESCDAVIQDGSEVPVNIRFKYGTINSDGRLDLCKQGFRNAFYESCNAVVQDKQGKVSENRKPLIKHYLIGNNRIGEDGDAAGEGNRRVAALANMIRHRPDIITWYLAGNSMDHEQIKCVTDALEQTQAKNIWLKMNPVKTGAYHLGKLIMRSTHVELLDVFNCGLCNNGLAAFAKGLADGAAENSSPPHSNLRHLYVSINGIDSSRDLIEVLAFLPRLESLFVGVNPFGDTGFEEIAKAFLDAVPCRKTLKRLNLGSMGLTDVSLPLIEKIVLVCPNLVSLELDSYKSTNYFCQPHNRFDVSKAATRTQLVKIAQALVENACHNATPTMHYLGLQHALVFGTDSGTRKGATAETKAILDDLIENQLHQGTGISVNGITNLYYLKNDKIFCHNGEDATDDRQATNYCKSVNEKEAKPLRDWSSSNRVTGGGLFIAKGVSKEDLICVRHPWPALDYIKSIYRNTMKV